MNLPRTLSARVSSVWVLQALLVVWLAVLGPCVQPLGKRCTLSLARTPSGRRSRSIPRFAEPGKPLRSQRWASPTPWSAQLRFPLWEAASDLEQPKCTPPTKGTSPACCCTFAFAWFWCSSVLASSFCGHCSSFASIPAPWSTVTANHSVTE